MADSQTVSSKKAKIVPQVPETTFETLPYDVVENIFAFLPIKLATQTCCTIGSSRFKDSMHLNQNFMFGWAAVKHTKDHIAMMVDRLFQEHRGTNIKTFQLYVDPTGIENMINKWLGICIQKEVEDIEFYLLQPGFTLSADFINGLKKLRSLAVVHCELQLPCKLQSMLNLSTLVLWHIRFSGEKLEALVRHCKLLETIDLHDCTQINWVKVAAKDHKCLKVVKIAGLKDLEVVFVDSPTLESVYYCGHVTRIIIQGASQLNQAYIKYEPVGNRQYVLASDVQKLVTGISAARVLCTTAVVPETLTTKFRGGVHVEASYSFLNLRKLQLLMEGGLFCNPYDIFLLLKHCPALQALFIDMNDYSSDLGPYWELHQRRELEKSNHTFDHLKLIKLKGFKFLRAELMLVKILLKKAIHLKALYLVTPKQGRFKINRAELPKYNPIFNSWKASPEPVKMVLLDNADDHIPDIRNPTKKWNF